MYFVEFGERLQYFRFDTVDFRNVQTKTWKI